ncbi:5'-methylthioadenosine/S-adenosylhomocysteine nucleosidase [Bacillus luteolus]|uniref:5'-methylthioadenosine/S-adenosylhomocysteine nucleosidase n=1 Tax=Litchfieldia luteola TaxID=682179 RepID=A0ABR9QHV3_9BACI|nr:5'-methylthioadenosine/S-adenosylhomocysteine nucleosidase [Cytobacillus luteolus]MBE4908070.1 5'-methylthioadenosine/S-adenosylhomocysteine nucleosidase [Cytobacillus luteolus]MBP1942855.1 adenosylhomocysteine nucleosidase [Cytobacillus luteolus]
MKVAIIGAMEEEVTILRETIENREDTTIAGCEFTTGTIHGQEVILLKSGIGKVNAAMSTTLLLQNFNPTYVINTGSAGGYLESLNVGDIVISSEVRHHDVDVTAFNYEYGQVPGLPAAFSADQKLVDIAEKCASTIENVQVVKGLIATGDSFMNDPERVEFVRTKFTELYAVEMEAAAIAQVCFQFGTPFVITRALSDIAGKESNVSFENFLETAAVNSSTIVIKIVEELNKSVSM